MDGTTAPGPAPADAGLGALLREAMEQRPLRGGLALGRLVRGWDDVVGPALGAQTAPRSLDDGVLVVAAGSPAWAVQVRFLAREIARAARSVAGPDTVREVRVVVHPEASKALRDRGSGRSSRSVEGPRRGPPSGRI